MSAVTNTDYWLHVVRNPWGHSDDEVRNARLGLADAFEQCQKELAELKADDSLTVAYMLGFHDGKKAAPIAECQARVQEPEGWKLVPIEPTSEMIAASAFDPVCATPSRRHIYQAMLLSAPKFKAKELK